MTTLTRRRFLQDVGAAGILAATGIGVTGCGSSEAAESAPFPPEQYGKKLEATYNPTTGELDINDEVIVRYNSCIGCFAMCGQRLKIDRFSGEILGQGGNPYNPANTYPYLDMEVPLTEAYRTMTQAPDKKVPPATVCGRSLGNLDTYRQPDRITVPLKRAGARGEGKWEPISWDQLITEVVEGGKLFEHLGEDREIEGFKALLDDELLVPDAPEFGQKANGLVHIGGRTDGRGAIIGRFMKCFGSVNKYSHHSSCYGARGVYTYQTGIDDIGFDLENTEYSIWLGAFPGASGYSVQNDLKRCVTTMKAGQTRIDVFDPNLGSGIVTPTQDRATWYPIKPATNAALALGMLHRIIESETYNEAFLAAANLSAARSAGFNACCNATHLVIMDETHEHAGMMMRPADAGLPESAAENDFDDQFVVIDAATGEPAVNLDCARGALEFDGTVGGVHVRTAFSCLKDRVFEHTVQEYADICGVPVDVIEDVAREFTSHGTKACINGGGGTTCLNGVDGASTYANLCAMIGSVQMKGGLVPSWTSSASTDDGERYLLSTIEGTPERAKARVDRTGFEFQDTSEYARRVAAGETDPKPLLPWYSGGTGASDNQLLMSITNGYPHNIKILMTWYCNAINASPGAMREAVIDAFKDPNAVPLHIACDIVEGTFARLADYYVPDTMNRESFGIGPHAQWWSGKAGFVQWPAVEPKTLILDDGRYASFDTFLIDVAEACGLPGYGAEALVSTSGKTYPLHDPVDYWIKALANVAYDDVPIADLSAEETAMQALDELPTSWKAAVEPEEWPKVLNVLSRGGRTWPIEDAFDGELAAYASPYMVNLYSEERASAKSPLTGAHFGGTLAWRPECFSNLQPIDEVYSRTEYPFGLANYKARFRSTSMLSNSPIMRELCPENFLEINSEDARLLGVHDGERITAVNPTGDEMQAPAMVRAGTARGAIGLAFGYSQYAYGSKDIVIGDEVRKGDPAIARGVPLMQMLDPTVGEGATFTVSDPELATPGRNGGMFKIVREGA